MRKLFIALALFFHAAEMQGIELGNYLLPAKEKVQVKDWKHPTLDDYQALQNYLKHADRPELAYLDIHDTFRQERMRNFNLIKDGQEPEFNILYLNGKPSNKKKCIVTYVSFNRNYIQGLHSLIERLKSVGFDGHIIYRIGGWPNAEEGCLELFDVPYAFKICALLEAKRLGYKTCLWLDSSVKPLKSLDPIFKHIEKNGMCFFSFSGHSNEGLCPEFAAEALGLTLPEFNQLKSIAATVIGLDFTNPIALQFLKAWHEIAKNRIGFLSHIPEQAPLCALVDRLGLLPLKGRSKFFTYRKDGITPKTILFLDWESVSPSE